jgi:HlyD family secretion protein
MKKRIPVLILVLAAAAAGVWWYRSDARQRDSTALEFYGNVDIREVNLGFRVSGRLQELRHDEGDAVKAGEVLGKLDDEPYQREAEQARGQAAALRARLQLLESGNRPQEIARARADLGEREVNAANAERLFKRQADLLSTKAVSAQDYDDAQARFREAEARRKSAREQLSLLEAGFRPEEIAQAKADLVRAEAALASAELHVADTVLKAPADGVVFTRAQEPGAVLAAGATVFTVSLEHPVWVRAYVHEPELGRVRPGMKVQIFTDSRRDKPYTGQIGYVSPRAEFTPKNVETAELRTSLVYRMRVVVDEPAEGLRQGMPVTLKPIP